MMKLILGATLGLLASAVPPSSKEFEVKSSTSEAKFETVEGDSLFTEVKEDLVVTEMTQEIGMQSHGYTSPDMRRRAQFKHYNNSYLYLSFRNNSLQNAPAKTLAQRVVARANLSKEFPDGEVPELKVTRVFKTYAMINVTRRDLKKVHRRVAKELSQSKEILAVEFLQHEKVFGYHAQLGEMSSFKSKVKKQAVEYDPEEVHKREAEERKALAEKDRKLREEQQAKEKAEQAEQAEKGEKGDEQGKSSSESAKSDKASGSSGGPGGQSSGERAEEATYERVDFEMKKEEGMFVTEKEDLQDLTHLWKQEGNMMIMRTQEEYEADMKREEEQLLKDEL